MSKAVVMESFGGPDKIELKNIDEPHAGPGKIRVRVTAAGLNPMDWIIVADDKTAANFGLTAPVGFGTDYAGVVDEVGDGVKDYKVGDRVFGSAISRAVTEHLVLDLASGSRDGVNHTPDGLDDNTASVLDIAGRTAAVALDVFKPGAGDTILIGGAAGGVGIFAIQLARLAGARVIGTGSEASFDFLRSLGAEPVAYGEGLVERVKALAPEGITAATDFYGTETIEAAQKLGVPNNRISAIAARFPGIVNVSGGNAAPGTLDKIAGLVVEGKIVVPIAATYPVEQIREAVEVQAARHVKGKIVVTI